MTRVTVPNLRPVKYYGVYLISSLLSVFIGILHNQQEVLLVYFYSLMPFILFLTTYRYIDMSKFKYLLFSLSISIFLITLLGWTIRWEIIPFDYLFDQAKGSEFSLKYWGIRYEISTRNGDYLYPLFGLALSLYFTKRKFFIYLNIFLTIFYIVTLFASLSRAATLMGIISLIFFIHNRKIVYFLIVLLIATFGFENFSELYLTYNFDKILSSIFTIENISHQFSNEDRIDIIIKALLASIYNPLGYGINNYSEIYAVMDYSGRVSNSAENAFLTILVERGLISFIFFCLAIFSMYKDSFRSFEHANFNKIILFFWVFYLFFNYELNGVFFNFILYFIFLGHHLHMKQLKSNSI